MPNNNNNNLLPPTLNQISWLCSYLKKKPALNNFDFSNLYTVLSDITSPQYDYLKRLISNNQIISIKRILMDLKIKQYDN